MNLGNDVIRLIVIAVILLLLITAGAIFRNNRTHPFYQKLGIATHILAVANAAVLLTCDFNINQWGIEVFYYALIFSLLIDALLLFYGAYRVLNLNRK
jgi:membrane-associated PAP2 superfamily phosphatase